MTLIKCPLTENQELNFEYEECRSFLKFKDTLENPRVTEPCENKNLNIAQMHKVFEEY